MCVYIFGRITFKILAQGTFTLIKCLFLHLEVFYLLLYLFISITIIFTIVTIYYITHQFSLL